MPSTTKSEYWNQEVLAFLDRQFPNAPNYKAFLLALWQKYLALGLPNAHFVSEFTSGKKECIFQRAWEMMLARHLDAQGHRLTSPDHGPDFRFKLDHLIVWVEAICPEPKGLPADWMADLEPNEFRVGTFPHNEILLRWTAALKEKWEKLVKYRKDGIIAKNDAYVIAINGCQLGRLPVNEGITRFPFAVEAAYSVGPLAYEIDKITRRVIKATVSIRQSILNANRAIVPTTMFVDPTYADVSAIICCTIDRSNEPVLPVDVIHNHFSRVPIPKRILGSSGGEWVTETVGATEVELRRLDKNAPKTIKIRQIGSPVRRHFRQRQTLVGLKLNKIGRIANLPDTPQIRGMIAKVAHLVKIID